MASSSTGVNVLRYTALASGILYGLYRQSTITASSKIAATDREFKSQSSLIQKAKAEYARLNANKGKGMGMGMGNVAGGVISDPDDPRFDLEAYMHTLA